jgi:hypothetical protein
VKKPFGPLTSEPPEWHADLDRYRRRVERIEAERTTVAPSAAADRLFALMAGAGKSTPDAPTPATFSMWWQTPISNRDSRTEETR